MKKLEELTEQEKKIYDELETAELKKEYLEGLEVEEDKNEKAPTPKKIDIVEELFEQDPKKIEEEEQKKKNASLYQKRKLAKEEEEPQEENKSNLGLWIAGAGVVAGLAWFLQKRTTTKGKTKDNIDSTGNQTVTQNNTTEENNHTENVEVFGGF